MTAKPLVYVVVDDMKSKLCDYCLSPKSSLMSCNVCKQMFYCNKICEQNDLTHHSLECHTFANTPNMSSATKIMMRLSFMVNNDPTLILKSYGLPNGQYLNLDEMKVNGDLDKDIVQLMDETDEESQENLSIKDMAVIQFKALVEKFSESQLNADLTQLWHLFTRLWSNVLNIDVYESNNASNAYGLYIELSALSHSCEPNACYVSYGTRLQVRAIKPIKPNERITISYIDIANPRPIRHQLLQSYFISCDCLKCQLNSDSGHEYEEFTKLNEELNEAIATTEDEEEKEDPLIIAENLVPLYDSIYGDFYPEFSLFLVKYLRIMLLNVIQSKSVFNRELVSFVLRSVRITHGVDHKIYRKVPVVRNITLLDLESDTDDVEKSLKQKPTSGLTKVFYGFLPFIMLLIVFICKQIIS